MTRDEVNLVSFGDHSIDVSDCDADACREFADHLRNVASDLQSGKFNGSASDRTATVLLRCTPTDGDGLCAAYPDMVRSFADDYEAAADVLGSLEE
jgi:hypothetical protein